MKTAANRKAMLLHLTGVDSSLSTKEKLKVVYHWYMFEQNLRWRRRATNNMKKHAMHLNYAIDLHNLQDLL